MKRSSPTSTLVDLSSSDDDQSHTPPQDDSMDQQRDKRQRTLVDDDDEDVVCLGSSHPTDAASSSSDDDEPRDRGSIIIKDGGSPRSKSEVLAELKLRVKTMPNFASFIEGEEESFLDTTGRKVYFGRRADAIYTAALRHPTLSEGLIMGMILEKEANGQYQYCRPGTYEFRDMESHRIMREFAASMGTGVGVVSDNSDGQLFDDCTRDCFLRYYTTASLIPWPLVEKIMAQASDDDIEQNESDYYDSAADASSSDPEDETLATASESSESEPDEYVSSLSDEAEEDPQAVAAILPNFASWPETGEEGTYIDTSGRKVLYGCHAADKYRFSAFVKDQAPEVEKRDMDELLDNVARSSFNCRPPMQFHFEYLDHWRIYREFTENRARGDYVLADNSDGQLFCEPLRGAFKRFIAHTEAVK